ncbi:hypothetical protein EJB05_29611 [Eragrostis curvula]|uniref:Uncharacterized protein n=1 Tax=Eragrostis curvula TaxID=38414 RepID=A0A5J9UTG6_9POAL|nr:hypothetical protein EJB05_29611 [Eragrostis curvula]
MDAALLKLTSFPAGIKKNIQKMLLVEQTLKWSLLMAGWMAGTLVVGSAIFVAAIRILSGQTWTILDAVADLVSFWDWNDGLGYLWLSVPQAAAAAVGLLLPRRHARSRWSLALVATASAAVAQYMNARVALSSVATNPGRIAYSILAGGGSVLGIGAELFVLISLLFGGPDCHREKVPPMLLTRCTASIKCRLSAVVSTSTVVRKENGFSIT